MSSASAKPLHQQGFTHHPLPSAHRTMVRCIDRQGARWSFFDARDIARIWVEHKAARFLVLGRHGYSERWLDESLARLSIRLAPLGFVRVHRNELINLRFLRAIDRSRAQRRCLSVELFDGQRCRVSRRFAPALRRQLCAMLAWPTRSIEEDEWVAPADAS